DRGCIAGADVSHAGVEAPASADVVVIDQVLLRRLQLEARFQTVSAACPVNDFDELEKVIDFVVTRITAPGLNLAVPHADLRKSAVQCRRKSELLEVVIRKL